MNHLTGVIRTNEVRKVTSDLLAERELTVGKGAGARKACGNAAGLAVYANLGLMLWAGALLDSLALLYYEDFLIRAESK
jgi:hypothetical protein